MSESEAVEGIHLSGPYSTIESAVPDDLISYRIDARLRADETRLEVAILQAALDAFRSSRPECSSGLLMTPALDQDIKAYADSFGALADWVQLVGEAFAAADNYMMLEDQKTLQTYQVEDYLREGQSGDLARWQQMGAVEARVQGMLLANKIKNYPLSKASEDAAFEIVAAGGIAQLVAAAGIASTGVGLVAELGFAAGHAIFDIWDTVSRGSDDFNTWAASEAAKYKLAVAILAVQSVYASHNAPPPTGDDLTALISDPSGPYQYELQAAILGAELGLKEGFDSGHL